MWVLYFMFNILSKNCRKLYGWYRKSNFGPVSPWSIFGRLHTVKFSRKNVLPTVHLSEQESERREREKQRDSLPAKWKIQFPGERTRGKHNDRNDL